MNITPSMCRAARALAGWSIADLSIEAALGDTAIHRFEHYDRTLTPEKRERLVRAFAKGGISFHDVDEDWDATGIYLARSPNLRTKLQQRSPHRECECNIHSIHDFDLRISALLCYAARRTLCWSFNEVLSAISSHSDTTRVPAVGDIPSREHQKLVFAIFEQFGVTILNSPADGFGLRINAAAETAQDIISIAGIGDGWVRRATRIVQRIERFREASTTYHRSTYDESRDVSWCVEADLMDLSDRIGQEIARRTRLGSEDEIVQMLLVSRSRVEGSLSSVTGGANPHKDGGSGADQSSTSEGNIRPSVETL